MIGELDRTTRRADPLGLDRVLDRDRQSVQGTDILPPGEGGIGRVGRRAGAHRIERDDGVDRRVQTFDTVEVELEQLAARDFAGPNDGRQLDRRPRRHLLVHQALLRVVPYSEPVSGTVTRVPAVDGWFTTDDEPHLIGARCPACTTIVFPPREGGCPNPECDSDTLEPTELSRRGRVWSYTENHYAPPPPYVAAEPFEPYALAAVELDDEGLVVLGQVARGVSAADLRVGMAMQLEVDTLFRDDDHEYLVYVWAPAAPGAASMSGDERRTRRRRSSASACTRGASGAATSPSTAWSRPGPRSPTPASPGATSSTSPGPTPSATGTRASSPARRSPRSWAGPACASRPATPRAPRARRRSTRRVRRSSPGSATWPW